MKENGNEYEDILESIARLILSFPAEKQREILNNCLDVKKDIA